MRTLEDAFRGDESKEDAQMKINEVLSLWNRKYLESVGGTPIEYWRCRSPTPSWFLIDSQLGMSKEISKEEILRRWEEWKKSPEDYKSFLARAETRRTELLEVAFAGGRRRATATLKVRLKEF